MRQEFRNHWIQNAKEHPDDPLALLYSGRALVDTNTPEEIRIFETLQKTNPGFPWSSRELARLYSPYGFKFADTEKMKLNLEKFYSACPAWTDPGSDFAEEVYLKEDPPLAAKTAVALRKRLNAETDTVLLKDYQILWQREFIGHPPAEHDAVRAQIRKDLKRLESLVPADDEKWQAILIKGYEYSGVADEELVRMEHAVAEKFPHGSTAEKLARQRFKQQHPVPDDGQKDTAAWQAYNAALVEFIKQLIRDFPDNLDVRSNEYLRMAMNDPYISKEDALAALNSFLQVKQEYGASYTNYHHADYATLLLNHDWEPERAFDYLKQTETWKQNGHSIRFELSDRLTDEDNARFDDFTSKAIWTSSP